MTMTKYPGFSSTGQSLVTFFERAQ